jgi:hypothetical protein
MESTAKGDEGTGYIISETARQVVGTSSTKKE